MIWIIAIWLVVGCLLAKALDELLSAGGRWGVIFLWPVLLVYALVGAAYDLLDWVISDHDKKEGRP
jgi:hypothetical protein